MPSDNSTVLQSLQDDLESLKNAIDAEDHAQAEKIVNDHDQRLRAYVQANGVETEMPALQQLHKQQQALIARMRELRDEAAAHLRQERQSTRAVNAYQQAGALP
ncbi:hypothetical protein [Stenotrophomonas sp. Iso1]|uniref:hypothetical protein n=1 Tax=Stenotrophomonas sp. Iso1 TaxID=2977283 RepID=UPI0022B77D19|nr:hypothetical protein [Stenotrophomonas sp. Iso1]